MPPGPHLERAADLMMSTNSGLREAPPTCTVGRVVGGQGLT